MTTIYYSKVKDVRSPQKNKEDAGWDFFVPNDFQITTIYPGKDILISSGIHLNIPENHCGIFFNKSGIATKRHLQCGAAVIDSGYQGEVHIHLSNIHSDQFCFIDANEKIVQLIFFPFGETELVEVPFDQLYLGKTSERGSNGFGSTN